MPVKSSSPVSVDVQIQEILNGNVENYVTWAVLRMRGLEGDRVYLKEQVSIAEQRCAAAERMHKMVVGSEAALRERAVKAEKRLAQAEAHIASMAAKRGSGSATNRSATNHPLEKAIAKLARNPTVVKKLVLVVHPDKCPSEVSDSATELFRFLQKIRDKTKP